MCDLQAAAASGSAAEARPAELDLATTIASFPPEVREEVLLGASEDILAQLPPAILAEAQALRQRNGARFAAMGGVPNPARPRLPVLEDRDRSGPCPLPCEGLMEGLEPAGTIGHKLSPVPACFAHS